MPLTSSSRFNSSSNRSTSAVAKAKATTLEVANDGGKLHKRDGRSMTTFSTHIRNKIEINTNSLLFVHASNTYLGENDIWKYCQLADTAKVKSLQAAYSLGGATLSLARSEYDNRDYRQHPRLGTTENTETILALTFDF